MQIVFHHISPSLIQKNNTALGAMVCNTGLVWTQDRPHRGRSGNGRLVHFLSCLCPQNDLKIVKRQGSWVLKVFFAPKDLFLAKKINLASMPALFYSQTHWLSTIPTTQTYPDRLSVARKIIAQNIPERIHTPSSLEQLQRPSTKKYCRLYVVLSLWLKLPWSRKGKVFQKAESYTFNPPSRNPYRVRTPSVNTVFGERSVYAWEKATLVVHLLFPATVQSKSCLRYSQLGCTLHQKNMWGSQWGSL